MELKIEGPYSITTNGTAGNPGVTTYHQGSIAPPVAAGSVDTPEFAELVQNVRHGLHAQAWPPLISYIDAWGAQQREAGRQEVEDGAYATVLEEARKLAERAEKAEANASLLQNDRDNLQKLATSRREWAEKAEADAKFKQACIDRLMLEFCPDEMTAEQVTEWASHQKRAE